MNEQSRLSSERNYIGGVEDIPNNSAPETKVTIFINNRMIRSSFCIGTNIIENINNIVVEIDILDKTALDKENNIYNILPNQRITIGN